MLRPSSGAYCRLDVLLLLNDHRPTSMPDLSATSLPRHVGVDSQTWSGTETCLSRNEANRPPKCLTLPWPRAKDSERILEADLVGVRPLGLTISCLMYDVYTLVEAKNYLFGSFDHRLSGPLGRTAATSHRRNCGRRIWIHKTAEDAMSGAVGAGLALVALKDS